MAQHDTPEHTGRLQGKVAIVSGAGTYGGTGVGNGAATAILFARHGANVALVDKELDWADATKATIEDEEASGEAISIQADVTDPDDCRAAVERTRDAFGGLDVLHNNVGRGFMENVVDASDETWQQSTDLNLMSMIYMCRHAVAHMRETGGGSVINISSVTARRPKVGDSSLPYTVHKTGVVGLTRGLALDHAADNVRVNCIMPGLIWTPRVASTREDERQMRRESTPIPKEGEPWDIGQAAVFLASDEAAFITGVTLPVDGGYLLTSAPS